MEASNKFSNLDYEELPTLFFEFHGSEKHIEDQASIVGMSFTTSATSDIACMTKVGWYIL